MGLLSLLFVLVILIYNIYPTPCLVLLISNLYLYYISEGNVYFLLHYIHLTAEVAADKDFTYKVSEL